MELFTCDRQVLNPDEFPERIAPFPETTNLVYNHATPVIPSPEIKYSPNVPPQKLRPIRCNGNNILEYSDPTADTQPGELLENGVLSSLLRCPNMGSPEVGFLSHQLCALDGDPKEFFDSQINDQIDELKCGDKGGNGFRPVSTMPEARPVISSFFIEKKKKEDRPVIDAGNHTQECGVPETESSASLDYGEDSSEDGTEPVNGKRKRKTRKKLETFMESLVVKVMQKQEQMHNQMIEMLENKEKERREREEAWKQQEMERAKKEEELRAQERSRSLALISFLENILGHPIPTPKPCPEEGEVHNLPTKKRKVRTHDEIDANCDQVQITEVQTPLYCPNGRWPKAEVQALIALRANLDHKFRDVGNKGTIWEEVSEGLCNMGYTRTAKKCREKWENINKYFRRTMENGKKRLEASKTCSYFQELEILYKKGLVYSPNASSSNNMAYAICGNDGSASNANANNMVYAICGQDGHVVNADKL